MTHKQKGQQNMKKDVTKNLTAMTTEIEQLYQDHSDNLYLRIQALYQARFGRIPSLGTVCQYLQSQGLAGHTRGYAQRQTQGSYYVQRGNKTYVMVQIEQGRWEYEHTLICKALGIYEPGMVIHHIDGNSCNNQPSNLAVMSRSDHARLHGLERAGDPDWRLNQSKKMKSAWARRKLQARIDEIQKETAA